ncbi:uncharacterized protein A4U43_C05F28300 [Asparagus officinalis]|uniref:Cleavage and polyadenylation specificity factor subunit 2 n=1 Tax=Asparagus officinalis TaxID=4686 RepID=A0A5P1EV78_ASPOF|nr:uncharacterized protein A4U43_C05F28300 [Asparagus officinalis]
MVSKIDVVLISHSNILHVETLSYAMKKLGLSAPVYSTDPVCRLGQLTMYDYYAARRIKERESHSSSCHRPSSGRHLNGTVLESFVWPAFLITDAYNALNNQVYKCQRDQEFLAC